MKAWIYFATSEKASRQATLATLDKTRFLWRSALNKTGARIANVTAIQPGDQIFVAWRHSADERKAYRQCTVAKPIMPVIPGLVIDRLIGPYAQQLVTAGYPQESNGEVEGIRLDQIRECEVETRGSYGGNNAIHKLAPEDLGLL